MKTQTLKKLDAFEVDLRKLRKSIAALTGERVSTQQLRKDTEELATRWVEELRSSLEHHFHLAPETIDKTSQDMKRLHVLSRPNNRKGSYLEAIDSVLDRFKDKFVLPIQQTTSTVETKFDLQKLVGGLSNPDESEYLKEAFVVLTRNSTEQR